MESSKVVLMIFFVAFICSSWTDALGLTRFPQNAAVLVGSDVYFTCWGETWSVYDRPRIQWKEFAYSSSGNVINEDTRVSPTHPQAARYSIVHDTKIQYDFVIHNVTLADGGTYLCTELSGGSDYAPVYRASAELVVIGGEQRCMSTIPSDESNRGVVEGQDYQTDCITAYKGNLIPNTRWDGPEPFDQIQAATWTDVYSSMKFNANRSMDQGSWRSVVNFARPLTPPPPKDSATNVPAFVMTYTTPTIAVHWPTKILRIDGLNDRSEYVGGDQIICVVDSSPPSDIVWTNYRTSETYNGAILTVDPLWVGFTDIFSCTATNVVDGIRHTTGIAIWVIVKESETS